MWITYPGDFEIWLGNIFNNRRTERGAFFPPFWKQDSHYITVEFSNKYDLKKAEELTILCEGQYNFMLDGKLQFGQPSTFVIPEGQHSINIKVYNQSTPPALFISSKVKESGEEGTIHTDSSWLATYEDKIWIDENGVAHGSGIYVPAATSKYFLTPEQRPSLFSLSTKPVQPAKQEVIADGTLYDFGKEMMALAVIKDISFDGTVEIYYGESREEALDHDHCETLDRLHVHKGDSVTLPSKAFRYVHVVLASADDTKAEATLSALYEYLPQDEKNTGSFECNDSLINDIWKIGAYTMDLTTREFMMDGIKRDRWTWSGDAIQSYLMNYYLRFDSDTVKRTIRQLRGKDPVTAHINTIMDYTFYWFKSVLDYYEFTGDIAFVREIYPRMQTLMEYVLSRLDIEGFAEGQADDWIFVDWVDFPMPKRGIMSFEQILLAKSYETMMVCAELLRDNPMQNPPQGSITTEQYNSDAERYSLLYQDLRMSIDDRFWDDELKAYVHNMDDGQLNRMVTKFPNMFAILFGYVKGKKRKAIMDNVMLNPDVEAITTPYMRFYELEALCQMGHHNHVLQEIRSYWGGMLKEGATSFWEKYVPSEHGTEHLQMYGRPYGKSLCHAWGASPVYLLGKYYLGIYPTKPGYQEWECRPHLADLEWMKGSVPTPFGPITISMTQNEITVDSPIANGKVYAFGKVLVISKPGKTCYQKNS